MDVGTRYMMDKILQLGSSLGLETATTWGPSQGLVIA